MSEPTQTNDEVPNTNDSDERDAVRSEARENGLYGLVFYGGEPWIALVDRDNSPSTSHALPEEKIAVVEWASSEVGYTDSGWAVSITQASDRQTNPDWETPGAPDERFESRSEAVEYAASKL